MIKSIKSIIPLLRDFLSATLVQPQRVGTALGDFSCSPPKFVAEPCPLRIFNMRLKKPLAGDPLITYFLVAVYSKDIV